MKTKILILAIILIGLGIGGFLVLKQKGEVENKARNINLGVKESCERAGGNLCEFVFRK